MGAKEESKMKLWGVEGGWKSIVNLREDPIFGETEVTGGGAGEETEAIPKIGGSGNPTQIKKNKEIKTEREENQFGL